MLVQPKKIPRANFDLYYAGTRTKYVEEFLTDNNFCRLLSYVNERSMIERHLKEGRPIFVDSGAFSAMTRGIEINVDDYIDWINKFSENMVQFCCWDTIPIDDMDPKETAKATWENYLYMYDKVNDKEKLVYCFHFGEPIEYLHKALEFGCTRIALGGVAKRKKAERIEFFELLKDEFHNYPNVLVHAFGMTDVDLLAEYDFIHSGDSTSWLWPAKFSECQFKCKTKVYFSDKNPEKPHHINNLTDDDYFAVEDEIAEYGFTVADFYGDGDPIKNRDVWQVMYWQQRFFEVAGGQLVDNKSRYLDTEEK